MSKTIDNLVKSLIEETELTGVLLAKLYFNPIKIFIGTKMDQENKNILD
jgi:hypothetical protein